MSKEELCSPESIKMIKELAKVVSETTLSMKQMERAKKILELIRQIETPNVSPTMDEFGVY